MICNTAMEKKHGLMGANIRDSMLPDRKTDMESISGQMVQSTMETGLEIKLMEKEHTHGLMGGCLEGSGRIIICMDMVYTPGKMAENMKVNIKVIKSTVREHICGPMDGLT